MSEEHSYNEPNTRRRAVLAGIAAVGAGGTGYYLLSDSEEEDGLESEETQQQEETQQPETIDYGGTLRVGVDKDITQTSVRSTNVVPLVYEPLFRIDQNGELYPWLVDDTTKEIIDEDENTMKVELKLRDNITFSNGDTLNTDDVIRSLEKYIYDYEGPENLVEDIRKGDNDLTIELITKIDTDILSHINTEIVHKEVEDVYTNNIINLEDQKHIGTGPYKITEVQYDESVTAQDGESVTLEKVSNYWVENMGVEEFDWFEPTEKYDNYPSSPPIDKIKLEIIPRDANRSLALQNGEIDVTTGLTSDTYIEMRDSDEFKTTITDANSCDYLSLAQNTELFSNKKIRQAVNKLVPRRQITSYIYNDTKEPAYTLFPEALANNIESYDELQQNGKEFLDSDDDEEIELLLEQGFAEENIEPPVELTLEVNWSTERVQTVELIRDKLNQIGNGEGYFDVDMETYEWTAYVERVLGQDYPKIDDDSTTIIPVLGSSGLNSPHSLMNSLHNSDRIGACCNTANVDNESIDEQLDNARFNPELINNPEKQQDIYKTLNNRLLRESYQIVYLYDTQISYLLPRIQNWAQYPYTVGYIMYGLWAPQDQQVSWINNEDQEDDKDQEDDENPFE